MLFAVTGVYTAKAAPQPLLAPQDGDEDWRTALAWILGVMLPWIAIGSAALLALILRKLIGHAVQAACPY